MKSMDMTTNAARRSRRASTGRDIVNVWDCLNAIPRANTLPNKLRNIKEAERYIGNPALLETKSPVVKKKKTVFQKSTHLLGRVSGWDAENGFWFQPVNSMGENEGKAKSEKSENIYPLPLLGETVPGRGKVSAYLFASESVQVTQIGPSVSAAEIPVFKKFEIRESGVKDAGDGLYLMESAADGEEIARYSGDVLTAQQARVSDSQYIVKVSTNVFLDASADGHWEGKMANCARKAKRKVNARILAASKPRFCKASKKFWLPMLAVGSIASGEEVFADYGDEFWPEGGRLQTPEANDAESEEEVYDDDMDPSWEPAKSVSKKLEQSSTAKDANTSNNKSQSNATKANTSNKNKKQSGATKSGKTKNTKKTNPAKTAKTRTTKSKRAVTKQSSASKAANTKQSNATKTKKKNATKAPNTSATKRKRRANKRSRPNEETPKDKRSKRSVKGKAKGKVKSKDNDKGKRVKKTKKNDLDRVSLSSAGGGDMDTIFTYESVMKV